MGGGDSISDAGGDDDSGAAADGVDLPAAGGGGGGGGMGMDIGAEEDAIGGGAAEAMGFDVVDVNIGAGGWMEIPGEAVGAGGGFFDEVSSSCVCRRCEGRDLSRLFCLAAVFIFSSSLVGKKEPEKVT